MKHEVQIVNADGTPLEAFRHLVAQLQREARSGTLRVNTYFGPEEYGSEAFYRLSDGTLLHETNGTAEDGADYRSLTLVVEPREAGFLHRLIRKLRSS